MPEAQEQLKDKPRSGVYSALLILACALNGGAIAFMYNELVDDYYYDKPEMTVPDKLTPRNRQPEKNPDARKAATDSLHDLARLSKKFKQALLRINLRDYLSG